MHILHIRVHFMNLIHCSYNCILFLWRNFALLLRHPPLYCLFVLEGDEAGQRRSVKVSVLMMKVRKLLNILTRVKQCQWDNH
jgi:hypothetical protein